MESLTRLSRPSSQIDNPNLTPMEEEIQIIVDIFVTCSSTLCFTLCVKPSKTIYSLKRTVGLRLFKYQGPDSCAVYDVHVFHAFFFGGQLLEDGLTLTECNISDMDRVSVFPCRPFLVNVALTEDPESGPTLSSIQNLLEDGYSALVDHDIEKKAELVLCQKGSFVIRVTKRGSDQRFTIEVESLDTVDVLKTKIQKITDIAPKNQILFHERDEGREVMYKGCLGRYGILKLSSPEMPEVLISNGTKLYLSQKYMRKQIYVPKIPLSFWKKFSDSAAAGVPLEEFLLQINSRTNLEASFKIYVLVRLNVCLIFRMMFTVGLGDTLESLKTRIKERAKSYKEIDDLGYIQQGAYVFLHNKHKLQDDGLLTMEQCGISNESEIILCPKASFTVEVCFSSSVHVKDIQKSVTVNCLDTVEFVKKEMIAHLGSDVAMQLYYNEAPLSGEKFLVDYGIVSHPVASVNRRWKACEVELKVIMDEKRTS